MFKRFVPMYKTLYDFVPIPDDSQQERFSMGDLAVGEVMRISFVPWDSSATLNGGGAEMYSVTVKDIRNESFVLVGSVTDGNGPKQAYPGGPVTLLNAVAGTLVVYSATTKNVLRHNPLVVEISTPKQVKEIQRRAFFRIDTELEVKYSFVSQPGKWCHATVRDISEGGICLAESEPMLVGERLQLEIPIDNEIVRVKGVVRRSYQEGHLYFLGVQFTEIPRPDQQKIRKFLFALQLRRGRRGD